MKALMFQFHQVDSKVPSRPFAPQCTCTLVTFLAVPLFLKEVTRVTEIGRQQF